MKNRDIPAMPTEHNNEHFEHSNVYTTGLTKREYIAAMAMQGCCANPSGYISEGWQQYIARDSVVMADALLKQLEDE